MIKHLILGEPLSTVGEQLGLQGSEVFIKGDTTYLQLKGWVDMRTREQVLGNYRYSTYPDSILPNIITGSPANPSYEQMLLDKVALETFLVILPLAAANNIPEPHTCEAAYNTAELFMQERNKRNNDG
jgi:hypothetical protein